MKDEDFREMITTDEATKYLRYISLEGIVDAWNYAGVVRNIEDMGRDFKVLNRIVGGPLDVDNVWGKVEQTCYLYLILKRAKSATTGQYGPFQIYPWVEYTDGKNRVQTKYPIMEDLYYEDEAGYGHYGLPYTVGKVRYIVPTQVGTKACALKLAGLTGSGAAEMNAWHATTEPKKQTINVTLGHDCWDKGSY